MKQRINCQPLSSIFAAIVLCLGMSALPVLGQENDLPDKKIANAVDDQLMGDRSVFSDNIDIETEDGIVTLSGTVDTWGERQAARDNALEAGAMAVDNNLKVEFGPNYYSQ